MNMHPSKTFGLALLCSAFTSLFTAHAVEFEYVKIVQSGDPLPGGGGTFGTISDFDLAGGDLVFTISSQSIGVFRFAGGALSTIATTATGVPGGGSFTGFISPSVSGGEVAFRGITGSSAGIYVTRNGNLSRIADLTTSVPSGFATFTNLRFGAVQAGSVNDISNRGVNSGLSNGRAVFYGTSLDSTGGTVRGLYTAASDGTLTRIVDATTAVSPASYGTIDGEKIAFIGNETAGRGVYRFSAADQSLTAVVPAGTLFPEGAKPHSLAAPVISGDAVAFNVSKGTTTYDGIYVADANGVRLVADGTTPVPGASGVFAIGSTGLGFNGVTLSNGNVAFLGPRVTGGTGIYTSFGGGLSEIASTDDTLGGSSITNFGIAPPKIDGSNILFSVTLGSGSTALYAALAEHHWAGAGGGAFGTAASWSFGLAPRSVIPTFLDPLNGGVITGPSGTTALKSLVIGASQSGLAEFRMQAGGQINVAGAVAITPRGRLETAGVLSAGGGLDNRGVITVSGTGQISGQLVNRESGEVRVGAGQRLTVAAATSSNAGVVDVTGGELEFSGALTNLPSTGVITARNATLRFGQLTNAGSLAIVAGTTDLHGDIVNTGSIAVSGGIAGGMQTAIFHDDVVQNGALSVSASGTTRSVAVFLGGFSGASGITGGGDVFFEGDLRPGNSPASVTYAANVSLANSARLTLELAGRVAGTQYDQVVVTGDFGLGGALEVVLLGGFSPQPGDTFDLFDFNPASRTGNFATLQFPPLAPGLSWDSSQLANTGALSVVPEPSSVFLLGLAAATLFARSRTRRLIA